MTSVWAIDLGFALFCVVMGLGAGCWLEGRRLPAQRRRDAEQRHNVAEDSIRSLHRAVESVQSCIEQHSECLKSVDAEIRGEGAAGKIDASVASIVEANALAMHQLGDLQGDLNQRVDMLREEVGPPGTLLLTTLSLDRQKHAYQQALASLESLAVEMARELEGHGRRVQGVSEALGDNAGVYRRDVTSAVTQLLDATQDLQEKTSATEKNIQCQADRLQMQAVLTHADLLTSLPNRQALEAQLEAASDSTVCRPAPCSLLVMDLDQFYLVNDRYGHHGGDQVLRQTASIVKRLSRGRDFPARLEGDRFAAVLHQTTLADALPLAERLRKAIVEARFSEGRQGLQLTASFGIVQLAPQESPKEALERADLAILAAQQAGGDACYWNDGEESFPTSSAYRREESVARSRDDSTEESIRAIDREDTSTRNAPLIGRSLFIDNLKQRLAEWRRGGPIVSVALLRIDQTADLLDRHGDKALEFLRNVMARLLDASTREMDHRCDYSDGVFALMTPGVEHIDAVTIAERLRSQVRHCKIRLGDELWDLSVSVGVADLTAGHTTVDVLMAAGAAMERAVHRGGNVVCSGAKSTQPQGAIN